MTQREVAARSGLPGSQISRIEKGHRLPSLETLERITAALQVSLSDVFYDIGVSQRASSALLRQALSETLAKAGRKGTGQEPVLVALTSVLPRLTGFDRELILSIARKMAAARQRRGQ